MGPTQYRVGDVLKSSTTYLNEIGLPNFSFLPSEPMVAILAYFFHASLQGTACQAGAAVALRHVVDRGLAQGLVADAQSSRFASRGRIRPDCQVTTRRG